MGSISFDPSGYKIIIPRGLCKITDIDKAMGIEV